MKPKMARGGGKKKTPPAKRMSTLVQRRNIVVPPSDPSSRIGLTRAVASAYGMDNRGEIEELPAIATVTGDLFNDLIVRKLHQCRIICNFTDPMADLRSKAVKQAYLQEIVGIVSSGDMRFLESVGTLTAFFQMVRSNLLRSLPSLPVLARVPIVGDDVSDSISEAAWPHIELVYQSLLKFLENVWEAGQVLPLLDGGFIVRFLQLFGSADCREREQAKLILHRLYVRCQSQRVAIRSEIYNVLITVAQGGGDCFPGVGELLEVLVSIINGFALPLRPEHVEFLRRVLIPLHGCTFVHVWHGKLLTCMTQFVFKDSKLVLDIVSGLLRFWPSSASWKELCFIQSLGRMLELSLTNGPVVIEGLIGRIYDRIGRCTSSVHFQVAEQGALLWRNEWFILLTTRYAAVSFQALSPWLAEAGAVHWHVAVRSLAVSIVKLMKDANPKDFEAAGQRLREIRGGDPDRHRVWRQLGGDL